MNKFTINYRNKFTENARLVHLPSYNLLNKLPKVNNSSKVNESFYDIQFAIEESIIYSSNVYLIHKDLINHQIRNAETHMDLLYAILLRNIQSSGFVPVSSVFNQFISHVTEFTENPSHKMTIDEAKTFLKDNARNIKFPITSTYNYGNKERPLVYEITDINKVSFNLPMVAIPRPWILTAKLSNAINGGYLHNNDLVRLRHNKLSLNNDDVVITEQYIKIINKQQETPYDIYSIYNTYNIHLREFGQVTKELKSLKHKSESKPSKQNTRNYLVYRETVYIPMTHLMKAYKDLINILDYYNIYKFYLNAATCFRGRLYTAGIISPTSDKVLRNNITPYHTEPNLEYINMDATASILQILAVITCSEKLAYITNLTSSEPIDTWTHIQNELMQSDISELEIILKSYLDMRRERQPYGPGPKFYTVAEIKETLGIIDRELVKKTIMRVLYGSNPFQIKKDFTVKYNMNRLSYKHVTLIIALFSHYFKIETEALEILRILNKGSIKANKRGLTIRNTLIQYTNTYYKIEKSELRFKDHNNKWRKVTVQKLDKSKVDTRKSNLAICANVFHTIDSDVCLSVVQQFQHWSKFIYTTHDSFRINSEDKDMLFNYYNKEIFKYNNFLINLIDDNINLIKISRKSKAKVNEFRNYLAVRRNSFMKQENNILNSRNTLKREFTTKTPEIMRYDIKVPLRNQHMNDYLLLIERQINKIPMDVRHEIKVMIYSNHIFYIGGASQKISTRMYRLTSFKDVIGEFYGKFESYGDDPNYIAIMQTIRFSNLNKETYDIIVNIDKSLKEITAAKSEFMPEELFTLMGNAFELLEASDEEIPLSTVEEIKEDLDKFKINSNAPKIEQVTIKQVKIKIKGKFVNNKGAVSYVSIEQYKDKMNKYKEIAEEVIEHRNKRHLNDEMYNKWNKLNTLANYYIRTFGFKNLHSDPKSKRAGTSINRKSGMKYNKPVNQ